MSGPPAPLADHRSPSRVASLLASSWLLACVLVGIATTLEYLKVPVLETLADAARALAGR